MVSSISPVYASCLHKKIFLPVFFLPSVLLSMSVPDIFICFLPVPHVYIKWFSLSFLPSGRLSVLFYVSTCPRLCAGGLSLWGRLGRRELSVSVSTCPRLCAGGCLCEAGKETTVCVGLCLHMSTSLCRWLSLWDRLGRRKRCQSASPHVHVFLQVVVSVRQAGKEKTMSVCVSTCPRLCAGGCLCETVWEGENCQSMSPHIQVFVQVVVSLRQAEMAGWEGDNCLCQSVSPHVHVFVQVVVSVRQAGKETTVLSNAAREATAPTAHKSASVWTTQRVILHLASAIVCQGLQGNTASQVCVCVCTRCVHMCECEHVWVCVCVCLCVCVFGMGRIMMGGGDCLNCDSTSGLCHHLPWLVNLCSSSKLVRV